MKSISGFAVIAAVTLLLAGPAMADGFGSLKGKLIVTGDVPELPLEPIGDHPDKPICLVDGEIPVDDNLVVDENGGLRDVFVMMYLKGKGADAPIHESYNDTTKQTELSIDNVACRFVPHALFVRTGQSVKLKNSDSVGHNCHITTFNNEHNVNLPAGGEVDIVLENAEKIPGQVKCDIHKWMDAIILIRDNPYVDISEADGTFEIKNIPEGEWKFQFWHKKGGYLKKLVAGDYEVGRRGELEVKIDAEQTLDMGTLEVPADSLNK